MRIFEPKKNGNRLMTYNWQKKDWPNFSYDISKLDDKLLEFVHRAGRVSGLMDASPKAGQDEALIELLVSEAIKTSEIEGEYLSRADVMSSVKRNLGFKVKEKTPKDLRAVGAAKLMTTVRDQFDKPLSEEMLFEWHRLIMMGSSGIKVGAWRTHKEPMQVVSGALGRERVHFEAPPSARIPEEMSRFIEWFNETAPGGSMAIREAAIRSAIAHLYFESIHPFEDGNGRIGRALSEKAISQGLKRPSLMSLSPTIEARKQLYYHALQKSQHSNRITYWISYFVQVIIDAQTDTEKLIDFTLRKVRFFDTYRGQLNERQLRVVKRMLAEGPKGFEGGMSAKKYMVITKTTKATATRDLQSLVEQKALMVKGAGRSTRYEVNL